ncbi:MAG TPA: fibronectin type III domain-containing protein [Kofleriaceae bacterium]|nr:fibronectin type III domain-containing protein [Kofleriaceae bacterium]
MDGIARALVIACVLAPAGVVRGDAGQCHVVAIDFVPTDQLQIAAWVEQPDGTFVDTIYLTQKVGLFGLGNRPGRFDFNSGPIVHDLWPYGRRVTVLPVWANRRAAATGQTFPLIVFQDGDDNNLSHPFSNSSIEMTPPYCRPMQPTEPSWDTGTCASSMSFTDKGTFDPAGGTSVYPPRADLLRDVGTDSPSVDQYKALDPFDAITQATPPGGMPAEIVWPIPGSLPQGNYVAWIEVGKAFDFNGTYNTSTYPPPTGIPWTTYGQPYRGQPSIVYRVPFTIGLTESTAAISDYAGYGDPTGATGALSPPDATITTDTPGTGAARLLVIPGTSDRIELDARPEMDSVPPSSVGALQLTAVTSSSATLQFTAPGDDGLVGTVSGYDLRYSTSEMTADNFDSGNAVATSVPIAPPGTVTTVEVPGLLPETEYWIGVRAYDKCRNDGPLEIVHLVTLQRLPGYVDACFVATAAYGSRMAADVEMLRHFRDAWLETSVVGELAVETYYTFGPPVAGAVGQSEFARGLARDLLAPLVARVRSMRF